MLFDFFSPLNENFARVVSSSDICVCCPIQQITQRYA